jgi:prepilin signal peptidase PulO-like enzyme (type II secretory pathway)
MVAHYAIPIVLGIVAGILVNYLADVLPVTRKLTRPACRQCGNLYDTKDYLFFKVCNHCGKQRDARAIITLAAMILVHLAIWNNPTTKLNYPVSILVTSYLAVVFVIDLEHRLILHPTSIFGSLLGLGAGWLNHGLVPTLLGGLAGFAIMLTFYLFGMLFTRIRARRMQKSGQARDEEEALGAGDVILAAIIGFMLGWPLIWFGLLAGILLGGIVSVALVLWMTISRQYKENALMVFIPYGPYFIVSTFLILYFPEFVARMVPG